jgi:phosphatidate cytidylyltransferase
MSELGQRVVVAVVAAPVAVAAIWFGGAALATFAAVLAGASALEFFRLARAAGYPALTGIGVLFAATLPLVVHAQFLGVVSVPPSAFVLPVSVVAAWTLFVRGPEDKPLGALATTVFGILYTSAPLSFAYALRYHQYAVGDRAGALMVLFPVLLTWANDVGAYFAGRAVGGAKLMPSVSPGKTRSGAVGGAILTVLVAWAFMRLLFVPYAQLAFTPVGVVVFAVAISIAAQIGDLVESLLKRDAGVKDSGALFPGHGGALDRLDSIVFVLPVAYALYAELLIPAPSALVP